MEITTYSNSVRIPFKEEYREKKYVIISNVNGGLGDISCGCKVADALHQRLGIPKDHLCIATNAPDKAPAFNKRFQFPVIHTDEIKTKCQGFALQIIIPASKYPNHPHQYLFNQMPLLVIPEYGFGIDNLPVSPLLPQNWIFSAAMGLDEKKNDIGIIIDQELVEWGFSEQAAKAEKRILKLGEASPALKEAILGQGDFFKQVASFISTALLYFGYSKDSCFRDYEGFIAGLARLNKDNDKDLFFVLPGFYLSNQWKDDAWVKDLAGSNISQIDIFEHNAEKSESRKIEDCTLKNVSGKRVTILTGHFTHHDSRALNMASEKETMRTGNQSAGEGISANKSQIYQQLAYTVDFGNSLHLHYNRHERAARFQALKGCSQVSLKTLLGNEVFSQEHLDTFLNSSLFYTYWPKNGRVPSTQKDYDRFIQEIARETQDAQKNLLFIMPLPFQLSENQLFLNTLKKNGIGELFLKKASSEGVEVLKNLHVGTGTKSLTILIGSFPKEDLLIFLKISDIEPGLIVLNTGKDFSASLIHEIFEERKKTNYEAITHFNEEICARFDAIIKIKELMEKALSAKREEFSYDDTFYQTAKDLSLIPFDTYIHLNDTRYDTLEMTHEKSKLEAFKDSIFDVIYLAKDHFLLKRKRVNKAS